MKCFGVFCLVPFRLFRTLQGCWRLFPWSSWLSFHRRKNKWKDLGVTVSVSWTGKGSFWKLALLVPQTPDPAGSVSSHLVARDVNQTDLSSCPPCLSSPWLPLFMAFYTRQSGFPGGSAGKESACPAGDLGSIPGSGRSPGGRNGNLPQYSCLENPMDPGAWRAAAHGSTKSRT